MMYDGGGYDVLEQLWSGRSDLSIYPRMKEQLWADCHNSVTVKIWELNNI